jgi:predicted metal-dependent hydrolase
MTKKRMQSNPFAESDLGWIRNTTAEIETTEQPNQIKQDILLPIKEEKSAEKVERRSVQIGLKDGWTRATVILKEDDLEKLKALAYWRAEQLKEVVERALELYFQSEGKNIDTALELYQQAKKRR